MRGKSPRLQRLCKTRLRLARGLAIDSRGWLYSKGATYNDEFLLLGSVRDLVSRELPSVRFPRSVLTPRVAGCRRRADMSGSHLGVAVASHKATGSRTPVSERGSSSTPGTSPGAVCSMPPSCSSRCACSVVQL